jgi:nucleoside recognition membrane protein YjiH
MQIFVKTRECRRFPLALFFLPIVFFAAVFLSVLVVWRGVFCVGAWGHGVDVREGGCVAQ